MGQCQFYHGLVSGGKGYSLFTCHRMKLVMRKKIGGKKERQNGIAFRYFSSKPPFFLSSQQVTWCAEDARRNSCCAFM